MKLPRAVHLIALSFAMMATSNAGPVDPVGYVTCRLVAGERGAMALSLVRGYKIEEPVAAVGENFVDFSWAPENLMGAGGSAFLEIRTGAGAGITLPVTSASGNRVFLARSPLGLVAPGDRAGVRPDWTIGELFHDPVATGIITGEGPEVADTVGIFNPTTQSMRVFYYKTDEGWREVDREEAGDMSNVPIPFPTAPVFHRRGSTSLDFINLGAVPMPYEGRRKVFVQPGRNLFSAPFTSATNVAQWLEPDSLVSEPSAPRSDNMKLSYWEGGVSRVFYYRKNKGWRFAGGQEDASNTLVEMYQAVDLQRVGAAGYLDFLAVGQVAAGVTAVQAPVEGTILGIDPSECDSGAGLVGWQSKAGKSYQLQINPAGATAWQDYGPVVAAQGETTRSLCRPEGNGLIRVLELP